ncbi:hypothetical protein EJ05DRAFT_472143, partial [Pseudovirgaria hyperparasitica]
MFAVPGWNLPATVKPQTAPPESKSSSKKRKRKDEIGSEEEKRTEGLVDLAKLDGNGQLVSQKKKKTKGTGSNTVEVGEKGAATKKSSRNDRRKKAREERLKQNGGAVTEPKEAASNAQAEEEQPYKKRKKDRNPEASKELAPSVLSNPLPKPTKLAKEPPQATPAIAPKPTTPKSTLTPLQAAMAHKLSSARFRHLNETLYTTPSTSSLTLFSKNPEMFDEYHAGFSQQVAVWPSNPVDKFISDVLTRGKVGLPDSQTKKFSKDKGAKGRKTGKDAANPNLIPVNADGAKPLPRNFRSGESVIADLGCGTAGLATALQKHLGKLKLKVHSYDLHSPSALVTKADISNLPLRDGELDIAIFCLALMGTNWTDFVDEAWRCLHWKGECWVGEIRSRFGRVQSGVVKNSIGSLDKRKQQTQKHTQKKNSIKRKAIGSRDSDDESEPETKKAAMKHPDEYLNTEIDDPDMHVAQKMAAAQDTELGPFLQVMRNHGFSLDGQADLSNKMFVKMVFIKNVQPVVGKNVKEQPVEVKGMKGKKFIERDELLAPEEEGKVLKPCVYKL